MNLRVCIKTCSLICLMVVVVASVSMSAPYKIYDETRFPGGSGNAYYFGGVFDGTAYVGHIGHGAQQWGDEQIGGTACLNATDKYLAPPVNNVAKAAISLGGWIYMSNGASNLCRIKNWTDAVVPQELPSPVMMTGTGGEQVPVYCDCITTDGTYIYVSSGSGTNPANGPYNTIYKYSVNHTAGTLTLVWASAPAGSSTSTHRFRAISYYNGKLYTSNNKGATVGHIFEVDCGDGAITDIATMNPTGAAGDPYQVVRYGNQIFAVSLNDCLYTFDLVGSSWVQQGEPVNLGLTDLYGIAVKGDGTTAKYAWITHLPGSVSFWDLNPAFTPGTIGDARKARNGYPVAVQNAVVTKRIEVNSGGILGEFWAEDKDRASAAHVTMWAGGTGSLPQVGQMVSMNGGMTSNAAGEKVFTTKDVTYVQDATVTPLYLNNKNLGLATGSAGVATDGMLVKVTGMLTLVDPYDPTTNPTGKNALYIDDGSGVANDKEGAVTGLKVTTASLIDVPGIFGVFPGTTEVTVTGIVRLEKLTDGTIIRKIEALSDNDILFTSVAP